MDRETLRKKLEADVTAKKAENQAKREALAKKFVADVEAYKKKNQEWTPALPGSAKLAMQNTAMERAKAEQERKRIEVESNIRSQTLHENIEHSDELVEKREKEAEANYKMLTVKERNLLPKNERADFNVLTYDFAAGEEKLEKLGEQLDADWQWLYDNTALFGTDEYKAREKAYEEAETRYKAFEVEHNTKGYELEALKTKDSVRRVMSASASDIDAAIAKLTAEQSANQKIVDDINSQYWDLLGANLSRDPKENERYKSTTDKRTQANANAKENEANIYYLNGIKSFSSLTNEQQEELKRLYGVLGYAKPSKDEAKANMKAAWTSFQSSGMSQGDYFRMVETLQAMDNALTSSKAKIEDAKFANKYPITASTISIFSSLLGGVASAADVASHALSNFGAKPGYVTPIDTNASTFALTHATNTMRGEVSGKIERNVGGTGGKIASFLYQTGMSGADSFAASFTGNWGGAFLLGSGSASNAFLDAKERGVSDSQAIWTGLLAGTFETLFERVSIGNLNALKEVPPATIKDVVLNVAKSAGVNASEEAATELANLASDFFINCDKSIIKQNYDAYVKQDMSESRAKWAAFGSMLGQAGLAGVGGAIMGVGMSGSVSTVGYLSNKGVNTAAGARYIGADGNVDTAAAEALINLGKASANETIRNYAAKLGKNVAKLDIKELGQLQRMLNAEKGADVKPKTIDLPNGMKPNDVVTIMEDDGSLRVMTAEDAAAEGRFEHKKAEGAQTGINPQSEVSGTEGENLSLDGYSDNIKKKVRRVVDNTNAISAMPESAESKVYSMLAGGVNNSIAEEIANTPALVAAFEKMTGVKLEGTMSHKRATVKNNASLLVSDYRTKNSESVVQAVKLAWYENASEPMIKALGNFGGAIYRKVAQEGVRSTSVRTGGYNPHQQFNIEFGKYYLDGYKGTGFSFKENGALSEADALAVYNAGMRDNSLALAKSATERSGIVAGATEEKIRLVERLSRAIKRDILFVNVPTINGETFNGCYSEDDGKIYINVNTKDAIVKVVAHEFTHSLESNGDYGKLLKFVFDVLGREGKTREQLREDKRNSASVYKDMKPDKLDREIVAQFVEERLLTDENVMREVVRTEGKAYGKRLHDVLNSLIEKIKAVFGKNTDGWTLKQLNTIEKGRKLLAEVIRSESGTAESGEVEFSLSPTKVKRLKTIIEELGRKGIKLRAGEKAITVLTDDFTVNKNVFSQKGRTSREVNARIKAIPDLENILRSANFVRADTDVRNIESAAKKGVQAMLHFEAHYGDYTLDILFRDKGAKQYLYEIKFIDNKKSPQQSMTAETVSPAPNGDVENGISLTHDAENVKGENDDILFSASSNGNGEGSDTNRTMPNGESELDIKETDRITEWSVRSVLYDALEKGDDGDNNLILLGAMPLYVKSKFGIDGGLYVFRNHIYENMVSEEQANLDGRNRGNGAHFHNLGEETLVNAILALDNPSLVVADKMKNGNPEISMVLPVFDEEGFPIHAALSFYKNEPVNGKFGIKPHIAVTFYQHPYDDYINDRGFTRDGLNSMIEKAYNEGRILDVSEKIRADLPVIAENPVLGNIAKSTLNNNIAEFKKKVKEFRTKNKISYSVSGNGGNSNDGGGSDVVTTEDEILARMLYYRENPDAAAQAKADYITQNAELEAKGKLNFIDGAINTAPRIVKKRFADEIADSWYFLKRKIVDSGEAVSRIGKEINDLRLYAYYNMARASTNAAAYMISGVQTDVNGKKVGEGLNAVFKPIKAKGDDYYHEFQKYLYHLHNIDRMSRQSDERAEYARNEFEAFVAEHSELRKYAEYQLERIAYEAEEHIDKAAAIEYMRLRDAMRREEDIKNKPVWGHEVDAAHSMAASQALEQQHPEFAELRDKVYTYIDNLMKYRVDSGLVTKEEAENLKAIYPHYVPTYRITDEDGGKGKKRKNSTVVGKTIGRAEGGDAALMPIDQALAKLTLKVVREGSKNRFGARLMYNGAVKLKKFVKNVREYQPASVDSFATADLPENDIESLFQKSNTFVIHDGGQMWEMEISNDLYEAVKALSPEPQEMAGIMKLVQGANRIYKSLITGWNPLFSVKNFERDLQDAGLYTTNVAGFSKAYPKAWKEMCTGGELWQQYQALGGLYSSIFDYRTGMADKKTKTIVGKGFEKIEYANMLIEQAPRFAEFISTVERGGTSFDNLMTAMHNAADITVNFGRSGEWGKWLNSTFIPFFNPGVQGFDKTVRMFKDNKGGRAWLALAVKAILLGIAPTFINELFALFGDWENWEDVKQRDKDTNYLINLGEGKYLKIPKGRVTASLSMSAMRVLDLVRGNEVDLSEYLSTLGDQIAPASPFESNIVTPWIQTALFDAENPGKTWYGSDIESQRLRNYAPGERFDENTDLLSRWIGKRFNLSPKKINYLLDSYTGVAGDFLIPLLTPNKGGISAAWNVVTKTFVLDSVSSNKLNQSFYDKLDSLTYNKNSSNASAVDKVMYRYFNKQATFVSDINAAIKKIQNDGTLTDAERKELLRVQQELRNEVEKTAIGMIGEYQKEVEYYCEYSLHSDEDEKIEHAYLMANKSVFGAEYAIKVYNSSTYKKAQACNAEGVSYEDFFEYYFEANNIMLTGFEKSNKKRDILIAMQTDDNTKRVLYREYISDSREDDIDAFERVGLDFNEFLKVQNQYAFADAVYDKSKDKAANFEKWVNKQKYSKKQKDVVLDCFKYFMHIPT